MKDLSFHIKIMCSGLCMWMVIVIIHRSNKIKSDQSISDINGMIYKAVP
jgi:hypothetical protein